MNFRPVPHPADFTLGPYGWLDDRLVDTDELRIVPGARSRLNLVYARPPGWRPLVGDLHLPEAAPVSGTGHPVVVYVHGGSFLVGDKAMEPAPWAALPSRGIAVFTIDYRLAGEVSHPEPIEDVRAAVQWVRARADAFELDPRRVAGWGSSAGGYLVGRVAFADGEPVGRPVGNNVQVSAELDCAVLHYPATDFSTALDDLLDPADRDLAATDDVISRYLGVRMAERPDDLKSSSLRACATSATRRPPLLLQHGDADHRSGVAQSSRLHETLQGLGAVSELDVIDGEDHATPAFASPRVVDRVVDFLLRSWSIQVDSRGH